MNEKWLRVLDCANCAACGRPKKKQSRGEPRRALCTRCRHSLPPTLLFELESAADENTFLHYLDRALTFLTETTAAEREAQMDRRYGSEPLRA